MERPNYGITKRRAVALAVMIALIFTGYSARLFQIQIVDGDEYADLASRNSSVEVPIAASRGEILDRYMRPMAVNRTSFSVVFDYAFFPRGSGDEEQRQQNAIILSLTQLLDAARETWSDTLPISEGAPYSFAEGRDNSIAALKGKLRMAEYATAGQCMNALIERYKLNGYEEADQRIIAGVRYEMELREFALKNPFTFSSDIAEDTYNRILENSAKYPGVNVQTTPVREYVSKDIAAHLIGTVGPIYAEEYESLKEKGYQLNDILGKSGIESAMEDALRGENGVSTITKDSKGTVLDKSVTTSPVPGDTVILTLDSNLQKTAQDAIADMIDELRAQAAGTDGQDVKSGSVVMLDVKTGGVLVCATWPNYDLSTYNADYNELIADPDKPLFNRALNGAYPCGSTMKPGVALAALTEGIITPGSRPVNCTGAYYYYASSGYKPTCMGRHGHANVAYALQESCNVFFYDVGRMLGIQKMNEYSTLYGLGQKTGIEVGESTGVLAGPSYRESLGLVWNPGDTCSAAIGQSDNAFTPIQLAAYCMTIANNGVRYKTHLVQSVIGYDSSETMVEPEVAATVSWSQEAIDTVRQGMRQVMTDGTASRYFKNVTAYTAAGKTGTAQTGIDGRSDHGVFIGYAPYDNPEVAIAVVLENGTSRPSTRLAKTMLDAYFASKDVGVAPTPEGELLP